MCSTCAPLCNRHNIMTRYLPVHNFFRMDNPAMAPPPAYSQVVDEKN